MGKLIQYATDFASQTFDDYPLSEIDILLLTELIYLYFDHIFQNESYHNLSLTKVGELFLADSHQHQQYNAYLSSTQRIELLQKIYQSPRYGEIKLINFINDINALEEKQFAAATYSLNSDTHLIVFRGTDDTLIGWKEDFNLSYVNEIPAQINAVKYIESITTEINGNFYISGHSKGGNLAIYAATKANYPREYLLKIYAFDALGFREDFLASEAFKTIAGKVHYYIPQESIVGELLLRHDTATIVKSTQFGPLQHDPKSWEIEQGQFVTVAETGGLSRLINETFSRWLDQKEPSELKQFFDTIFSLFQQSNITSLNDLTNNFWECIKQLQIAIAQLNPELRNIIDTNFNGLLYIAWTISKEKNIKQYHLWQKNFEEWFASLKDSTITQLFSDKNRIKLFPPPRTQLPINPITKNIKIKQR